MPPASAPRWQRWGLAALVLLAVVGFYALGLHRYFSWDFIRVNLDSWLTPIRVTTFAAVSWLGMSLGTFLYANAGTELATLDSPADLLTWKVLGSLALLGIVPLAVRQLVQGKVRWRTVGLTAVGLVLAAVVAGGVRTHFRYQTADTMQVAVREYTNAEYPEDPANRSLHHGKYNSRQGHSPGGPVAGLGPEAARTGAGLFPLPASGGEPVLRERL